MTAELIASLIVGLTSGRATETVFTIPSTTAPPAKSVETISFCAKVIVSPAPVNKPSPLLSTSILVWIPAEFCISVKLAEITTAWSAPYGTTKLRVTVAVTLPVKSVCPGSGTVAVETVGDGLKSVAKSLSETTAISFLSSRCSHIRPRIKILPALAGRRLVRLLVRKKIEPRRLAAEAFVRSDSPSNPRNIIHIEVKLDTNRLTKVGVRKALCHQARRACCLAMNALVLWRTWSRSFCSLI